MSIKKENENGKTTTYNIKMMNSVKFVSSSISSLANNLVKGLHKDKRRLLVYSYVTITDGSVIFKCIDRTKKYEK